MPFQIIRNDITKVASDAIVNTANPDPVIGAGTDSAIYRAAGEEQLLAERKKIGPIHAGEAAVTPAFALPAKYIIHTVGPIWEGGGHGEFETLASCYRKSLLLARQLGCGSIAFPLISTGVYGFPKDKALTIALDTIRAFLEGTDDEENEMDVSLVVFDKASFDISSALVDDVRQFIDDRYAAQMREEQMQAPCSVSERPSAYMENRRRKLYNTGALPDLSGYEESAPAYAKTEARPAKADASAQNAPRPAKAAPRRRKLRDLFPGKPQKEEAPGAFAPDVLAESNSFYMAGGSIDDMLAGAGESFRDRLLRLIDERGLKDAAVYKKANIDRKLFSKIRCNEDYSPKKSTALALAIALELDLDETEDLIRRAGFAFSPYSKSDLIIEYCILNHIYNIFEVNALLFEYDQQSIGC